MYKFAQALRRMRQEEKGFTLVELMVVVVIIGVLAAVAIPQFSGIITNSKVKADVATGKTIKDALDRYYTDHGSYPTGAANVIVGTLVNDTSTTPPTKYLNAPPRFAQNSGGSSAVSADIATFNKIFQIDTSGNVTVWPVDSSGTVGTTAAWSSAS